MGAAEGGCGKRSKTRKNFGSSRYSSLDNIVRACVPGVWQYEDFDICHSSTDGMLPSMCGATLRYFKILAPPYRRSSPRYCNLEQRPVTLFANIITFEANLLRIEILLHSRCNGMYKSALRSIITHHPIIITPQILTLLSISPRNAKANACRSSRQLANRIESYPQVVDSQHRSLPTHRAR